VESNVVAITPRLLQLLLELPLLDSVRLEFLEPFEERFHL
jgi:hypothetical protein